MKVSVTYRMILLMLMLFGGLVSLSGQTAEQRERLLELSEQFSQRFTEEKAEALRMADSLGWPVRQEFEDGRVIELMRIREDGMPMYYTTHNAEGATLINSDKVYPGGSAGLSLTGAGQTLGIWDESAVRLTHQEFQTNGTSRVSQQDGATSLSNHATHVAGTMIAGGVTSNARGMSYEAFLDAYDWNNDDAEMAAAATLGLQVSQHSYGWITGWAYGSWSGSTGWHWLGNTLISETEDYFWGFYNNTAAAWDNIAFNAPNYLIVKSSGNDRYYGPANQPVSHYYWEPGVGWTLSTALRDLDGGDDGYQSIAHSSNSKNIMVVGSVDKYQNMANSSSSGPTDDGRIKPDIVAKGVSVYSTVSASNSAYATYNGTSMSGPMVSGSVGLLLEHQENLHPEETLLASTIKALILHSADSDISGAPGPDYRFGWGLMDTEAAAGIMTKNADHGGDFNIRELTLSQGGNITIPLLASEDQPIKATMVWTDPPGTPPSPSLNPPDLMLVNDLDMRIYNATTTYYPYILDPDNPAEPATTGDNFRDNVEQILIDSPEAGMFYTLSIDHKNSLEGGEQHFSLVITGIEPATSFIGGPDGVWNDPDNWTHGVPDSDASIILPSGSDLTIDEPLSFANLYIAEDAILTLDKNASLTIDGTLAVGSTEGSKGEALMLKASESGSASLIHNTPGVPAEVQYHLKGAPGAWQQIAPPVEAQDLAEEAGSFGEDGIFFAWHEPLQTWVSSQNTTYYPTWADANQGETALVPFQGYMAAWEEDAKGRHPGMPHHQNKKRATNGEKQQTTKSFSGLLNTGNQSYPITRLAHPEDGFAGFNLIGNPYPSYIDWNNDDGWEGEGRELLQNDGDGYSYWVWDATNENYGAYNSASHLEKGTLKTSRYIPPAQGLWVRAAAETVSGTLTINNNARTHKRPPEEKQQDSVHFTGQQQLTSGQTNPEAEEVQYLKLSVVNAKNNFRDELMLEFGHAHNSGTAKVFSMNANAPGLYAEVDDKKQSISLMTTINDHPVIPLGFHAGTGGDFILLAQGAHTINTDVILHDRLTGIQLRLGNLPEYAFLASSNDMPNRFEILLKNQDLPVPVISKGEQADKPNIYSYDNVLFVEKLNRNNVYRLEAFGMNGDRVLHFELNGVTTYSKAINLPAGIYIVRLTGERHVVNKKIVLQ